MSEQLALWSRIPVRQNLWPVLVVLCAMLVCISAAQRQPEANSLSADQVIQILQSNPEALADAKTQIQNTARDSGYPVNQSEITDDRVFSKVRSDDQFRFELSAQLKERGYGSQPDDNQSETDRPREKLVVPQPDTNSESRPSDNTYKKE